MHKLGFSLFFKKHILSNHLLADTILGPGSVSGNERQSGDGEKLRSAGCGRAGLGWPQRKGDIEQKLERRTERAE